MKTMNIEQIRTAFPNGYEIVDKDLAKLSADQSFLQKEHIEAIYEQEVGENVEVYIVGN